MVASLSYWCLSEVEVLESIAGRLFKLAHEKDNQLGFRPWPLNGAFQLTKWPYSGNVVVLLKLRKVLASSGMLEQTPDTSYPWRLLKLSVPSHDFFLKVFVCLTQGLTIQLWLPQSSLHTRGWPKAHKSSCLRFQSVGREPCINMCSSMTWYLMLPP